MGRILLVKFHRLDGVYFRFFSYPNCQISPLPSQKIGVYSSWCTKFRRRIQKISRSQRSYNQLILSSIWQATFKKFVSYVFNFQNNSRVKKSDVAIDTLGEEYSNRKVKINLSCRKNPRWRTFTSVCTSNIINLKSFSILAKIVHLRVLSYYIFFKLNRCQWDKIMMGEVFLEV